MTKYSRQPFKILIPLLIMGIICGAAWAESSFEMYFPQIADGSGYQTTFALTNNNNVEVRGTLTLYQNNGLPLAVTINNQTNSTFAFSIPAFGMLRLQTDGNPAQPIVIRTGWAKTVANYPLGGVAVYQMIVANEVSAQAGVLATQRTRGFSIIADSMGFSDTGFALVNPNGFSNNVLLKLMDKSGIERARKTILMGANYHLAEFITERFSDFAGIGEFEGSMVAEGQYDVVGVTLRYDNRHQNVFTAVPVVADPIVKPEIMNIIPNAGSVGSTVTIFGRNFDLDPAKNIINFGAISVAASNVTPAGLVATVPDKAVTGAVSVSVANLTSNGVNFYVDPPSFGVIDSPREGSVNTGTITVSGYALDINSPGVAKVNIILNGGNLGEAVLGIARADVATAFPNYPNSANSGFLFQFDSYKAGNGVHQLTARVTNARGDSYDIATRNIVVDTVRKPVITSISPTMIKAGSASMVLNVSGKNFFSISKIYFGDVALTTTFNSSQSLSALVPASLLVVPGNVGITVRTEAIFSHYTSDVVNFIITP